MSTTQLVHELTRKQIAHELETVEMNDEWRADLEFARDLLTRNNRNLDKVERAWLNDVLAELL